MCIALVLIFGFQTATSQLNSSAHLGSSGNIDTLNCETNTDHINWGRINQGESQTIDILVRVTYDTPATLSFQTSNWIPANAEEFMTLTWDYDGSVLQPMVWTQINLTLDISEDIGNIDDFSFDTTIIATGA